MPVTLEDQSTVTNWARLLRRGYTAAQIRAQLDAHRWRRRGFAIVLHNGPLTRDERWYVARTHGGPGAVLTSFTAAEACGLRGWEREPAHVLARPGSHGAAGCPVPICMHHVRDWTRVRRHPHAPVQILPQALLVAAASFPSARPACGLLAAAVQQQVATPTGLNAALDVAQRVRHRSTLRLAIADITQGAEALSEIDFVRLCRRAGLPVPTQQLVRHDASGRRRYLDATWRRADGRLVVVEVDGALHLSQSRWWDDQTRQNELVLEGAIVLRFPSVVVRTQPELVAHQLRRALLM